MSNSLSRPGPWKKKFELYTLPETHIFAPEHGWLEYDPFLLGPGLFSGANLPLVSGRVFPTPGIPTTIKTMGVNITTIVYLRVLIIEIGSTIILMVVEA